MLATILFVIVLCAAIINILLDRKGRTGKTIIEVFLFYFLVLFVGIGGILGFVGHAFLSDNAARALGLPVGGAFQFGVAMADLAFGLLGLMCIWMKGGFWTATGIGSSVFFLGVAYTYAKHALIYKDVAAFQVYPLFYVGDILVPLVVLALIVAYNVME